MKRNKTNPTLSIGAAPPQESPQPEDMRVTPQNTEIVTIKTRGRGEQETGEKGVAWLLMWHYYKAAWQQRRFLPMGTRRAAQGRRGATEEQNVFYPIHGL